MEHGPKVQVAAALGLVECSPAKIQDKETDSRRFLVEKMQVAKIIRIEAAQEGICQFFVLGLV